MFGGKEPILDFRIAPIIDPDVAGDDVYNTEFVKLSTLEDLRQSGHKELSADVIHEICTKRVTNNDLKRYCVENGIEIRGQPSNEDMRRLLMKSLETGQGTVGSNLMAEMNKLFPSFSHTNGGFLFGLCEHGIVYYVKFLIRGEGSRDILDAVLSFKHPPKYVIYDDAGRLAEHAKKRLGIDLFTSLIGPDDGRVLAATPENISRAKETLKDKRSYIIEKCPEGKMLLLYDRLHENNSKSEAAVLRRADLVLRTKRVNTQHAEEFNQMVRGMTKSLNVSMPHLMMNFLRRHISDMNCEKNKQLRKKLQPHSRI